ncbi:MAG: delta-60 repeat domain-containing protein [Thermotoga caldifontis]|uniref:delta-60 repeat domain-containing protein n=1 Tax=Thermotoga caldifontis TaxID=1508419 RepID=UPI003C7BD7DC
MNRVKFVTILSITAIFFLLFALASCTSPGGGSTPVVITWAKWYGGSSYDRAYSIQQTSDGGYIVAGYTGSFGAGGDVYILKLDSDGNL